MPLIALTAVAVGGVMGGVMQRFGQAGFWVVWVFSMLLGASVGKVADIIASAQNGLFFRIRQISLFPGPPDDKGGGPFWGGGGAGGGGGGGLGCAPRPRKKKKSKSAGARTTAPEKQFLRMASSDFPDSRRGCLRKAFLLCIKSCRFRGAGQFWRRGV